jgi:hypothetical protein
MTHRSGAGRRFGAASDRSIARAGGGSRRRGRGDAWWAVETASMWSGSASVERAEFPVPGKLPQEEQLVDLADRPADLIDRDAAHERRERGRLIGRQAPADQQAIRRARDELRRLVGDAGPGRGRRASQGRGTRSTRGRRRENPRRRSVTRRSPASPRTSLCRPVHVPWPLDPSGPAPGVRCGTGMLISDPIGSDDPWVPCHPVLPAIGWLSASRAGIRRLTSRR